jgi:outer membrane protein OmpA-like peptidoglycan-associated protein
MRSQSRRRQTAPHGEGAAGGLRFEPVDAVAATGAMCAIARPAIENAPILVLYRRGNSRHETTGVDAMIRMDAFSRSGFAAAGIFIAASLVLAPAASAQSVSSQSLVEQLQPKKPLTRSFSAKPARNSEDAAFVNGLPTRGIRIDQRKKLDEIVTKEDLPRVDIEIQFDYDSASIRRSSIPDINELGKALSNPSLSGARFVLNGHTDAAGSDNYNQDLSDRRAASVREYLISNFGISPDRLIAIGYGEERLKNDRDPLAAENRRVEVINLTSG